MSVCRRCGIGIVWKGDRYMHRLPDGRLLRTTHDVEIGENPISMWTDKRVLVAGARGMIGSYLTAALHDAGARVSGVDLEHGDLRNPAYCGEILDEIDVVFNLAAMIRGIGYSLAHNAELFAENIMVSIPLLAAAAQRQVRYVAFSSSCIYPASAASPIGLLPATEGVPLSGYGWSKRVLEAAVSYYREAGLDALVVRPFNMYGAFYRWRPADEANVIPALVSKVLDGQDPVVVWGSGQQRRSFLHGRDAAALLLLLAANPAATLVNLGYEQDVSMAELIALICDVAGRRPRIVYDRSRPEGPARRTADSALLRSLTGNYEPKVGLREGIAEMIDAYQARSAA